MMTGLNVAKRCASLSNTPPGQQAYGLVAAVSVYLYRSVLKISEAACSTKRVTS
jgi:hypothetical protein